MASEIETHPNLTGFFEPLVEEALRSERVELSAPSRVYVLQLLSDFVQRDLMRGEPADEAATPALVDLYQKAVTSGPREQFDAYRHLGDVALVVSGLFPSRVERSLVGVDYYVSMGGAAYGRASALAAGGAFSTILQQLSSYFRRLVEVLTRIAERTMLPVKQDVGALVERWMRNPDSNALCERLAREGLAPVFAPVFAKNNLRRSS